MKTIGLSLEVADWFPLFLEQFPGREPVAIEPFETRRLYRLSLDDREILLPRGRGYAPGLARDMESMLREPRLDAVLRLGTCGGYLPSHQIGDLVLCTGAIRGEGTTHCYIEDSRFPAVADFELTRQVADCLRARQIDYRAGLLWATDGRVAGQYDPGRIDWLRRHSVLGVEMQSSTLFVLGSAFGVPTADVSIVVDLPSEDDPFAPSALPEEKLDAMVKVMAEIVQEL